MGRKHSLAASVSPLIDGETSTLKDAVTQALLKGLSIPDTIRESTTNSIAGKMQQYMDYGKKGYVHGLPGGTLLKNYPNYMPAVQEILNSIEKETVEIESAVFKQLSSSEYANLFVHDTSNSVWDRSYVGTEITLPKGGWGTGRNKYERYIDNWSIANPVEYIHGMHDPFLTSYYYYDKDGHDNTTVHFRVTLKGHHNSEVGYNGHQFFRGGTGDRPAPEDSLVINLITRDRVSTMRSQMLQEHAKAFPLLSFHRGGKTCKIFEPTWTGPGRITDTIESSKNNTAPPVYIVNYRVPSTGKAMLWVFPPELGGAPDGHEHLEEFYSVLVDASSTPEVKGEATSSSFAPIVPVRIDNQSITKNNSAYSTSNRLLSIVGVDIEQVNEVINDEPDIEYIEDAFVHFGVSANSKSQAGLAYLYEWFKKVNSQDSTTKSQSAYVSDLNENTDTYKHRQEYDSLPTQYQKSVIVIKDSQYIQEISYSYITIQEKRGSIGAVGTYASEIGANLEDAHIELVLARNGFFLGKQIDEEKYIEIGVFGLSSTHTIHKKYDTTSYISRHDIYLPLDYQIAELIPPAQRADLLTEALVLTIYSYHSWHEDWYESSLFMEFVGIIGIVISIATFNPAGLTWASAAKSAAIYLLVVEVAEILVKELGIENSFIVAAVLIVAAGVSAYKNTSGLLSADKLMLATSAVNEGISTDLSLELKEFQKEMQTSLSLAESRTETIERAEELLATKHSLNPLDYVSPSPLFFSHESPEIFYRRTIHTTNPGIAALDAIESFVSRSLILPKFDETEEMIRIAGQTTIG